MSYDGIEIVALIRYNPNDLDELSRVLDSIQTPDEPNSESVTFGTIRSFGFGTTHPFNVEHLEKLVDLPWDLEFVEDVEWELEDTDDLRVIPPERIQQAREALEEVWNDLDDTLAKISDATYEDDGVREILTGDEEEAEESDAQRLGEVLVRLKSALDQQEDGLGLLLYTSHG